MKRLVLILFVFLPVASWHPQLETARQCYERHAGPSRGTIYYTIHEVTAAQVREHDAAARAVAYSDGRIFMQPGDTEALEHEFLHHVLWANGVRSIFHHHWMQENSIGITCGITYVRQNRYNYIEEVRHAEDNNITDYSLPLGVQPPGG